MPEFKGFPDEALQFLAELTANNERDWWADNKHRYEALIREPARALIRDMGERMATVAPHLVADDRKSGGSLMRVFRDTRFGADKTPYKTNVGIQFRHSAGKDVHAPGLYVHLSLESTFLGVGMWRPDSPSLTRIRAKIDAEQDRWKRIINAKAFTARFDRDGQDTLKRPPRGYDKSHPMVEELKRKSHIAVENLDPDALHGPDVVDLLVDRLKLAKPYATFLCEAIDQAF